MAALAFLARLVLTLLLSTLSLCVYKWLRTSSPLTSAASTKRTRKRSRKKPAQKPAPAANSLTPPAQALSKPLAPDNVVVTTDNDDASASDSDDGCSAAQVLAKRHFKPKSLGGSRLARHMKASVVPATDATQFNVDDKVLARFQGGDKWFPATVLEQRKGHVYHLKYDDGEIEFRVPAACIKPQQTTMTTSEENGEKEGREAKQAVYTAPREQRADDEAGQSEASNAESSASDDEGWQVVRTSRAAVKRPVHRLQAAALPEPLVEGLTKRQRENRRKKERQREKKELLRQQAQKDDLDARARWRYVPS